MTIIQNAWHFISDNPNILWGLGIFSLITFLASLLLIPLIVVKIPEDHFVEQPYKPTNTLSAWLILISKNVLGWVLIVLGIAMLVLPGQGLLTIAIGVLLISFPRKTQFQHWLFQLPAINHSITWLRNKAGQPPLLF